MATFDQDLQTAVDQATEEFTAMVRGGVDLTEVFTFLLTSLSRFLGIAQQYTATPQALRRRAILGAVRRLYRRVNPDIPFVPEFIETFIEQLVLDTLMPVAYDWLQSQSAQRSPMA